MSYPGRTVSQILHRDVTIRGMRDVERILIVRRKQYYEVTYNFPDRLQSERVPASMMLEKMRAWNAQGFREVTE